MAKKKSPWKYVVTVLLVLFIVSFILSAFVSLFVEEKNGNVAIIPVQGVIVTEDSGALFSSNIVDSSSIIESIEKVLRNPQIKAIIFEIDSPGGTPVATDEIATAIGRANITTVAWIREVGASGAYWVASATDHVVANRMSITGSIGVLASYLEFSGLLEEYNVTYEQLTGGKFKDIGVPFRKLEPEERRLLQKKIDMIHQIFKDEVQKNRGLTKSQIDVIGTGEFFLGSEGISLGIIDELGGKNEAIAFIERTLNISVQTVVYEREEGFLDRLGRLLEGNSFSIQTQNKPILR